MVYDVTNADSFVTVKRWLQEIDQNCDVVNRILGNYSAEGITDCSIPLVGNKNDCPEKKVVSAEDAQKFSEQIGIELYETSAKENLNVEEVGHIIVGASFLCTL